jgi:ABC-2 type transport system permease protein
MFRNIFLKTLYEKRCTVIGWTLAVVAMNLLLVCTFPMVESLGDSLKQVPESARSLFGDIATLQTLKGYFDLKIINQIILMTLVLAIILYTELIAGKEEKGTLQSLLAQPVKRSTIFTQFFLAASFILAIVCLSFYISTVSGAIIIKEQLDWIKLFWATFSVWLTSVVFGAFAYLVSSITGKRGFSGMLAGAIAFAFYLITILEPTIKQLKNINYFSPFRYYNTPSVLTEGLKLGNVLILASLTLLFFVIGYWVFIKRDIRQK